MTLDKTASRDVALDAGSVSFAEGLMLTLRKEFLSDVLSGTHQKPCPEQANAEPSLGHRQGVGHPYKAHRGSFESPTTPLMPLQLCPSAQRAGEAG